MGHHEEDTNCEVARRGTWIIWETGSMFRVVWDQFWITGALLGPARLSSL